MRSGAFGTRVCQPARAATRCGHTSLLAGFKRNTQPHGVGLCRPHHRAIPATRGGTPTHRHNERSAYWCLCRRRHNHQLRHAHTVELARERGAAPGYPKPTRQHSYVSTTSVYVERIDVEEIMGMIHARRAPMMHASAGLELCDAWVDLSSATRIVSFGVALEFKPQRIFRLQPVGQAFRVLTEVVAISVRVSCTSVSALTRWDLFPRWGLLPQSRPARAGRRGRAMYKQVLDPGCPIRWGSRRSLPFCRCCRCSCCWEVCA